MVCVQPVVTMNACMIYKCACACRRKKACNVLENYRNAKSSCVLLTGAGAIIIIISATHFVFLPL